MVSVILGALYIAKVSHDMSDIDERDKITYKTLAVMTTLLVSSVFVLAGLNKLNLVRPDFIVMFFLTGTTFMAIPVLIVARNDSMKKHSFLLAMKCYQSFKNLFPGPLYDVE